MRLVCGRSKIFSPCHCPGIALFFGLALQCSLLLGIRLEKVFVPNFGMIGESVTLECQYSLEQDKLLSLKWYGPNGNEFFRYMPSTNPNIATYQNHGVQVDTQQLNNVNKVVLRKLVQNNSGIYTCEVSSEKYFQTVVSEEKNLTVIIPPNPLNPRLKFSSTVLMSDLLSGNCTSYRSNPAPNLTFYINEKKWSDVTLYEPLRELNPEGQEVWTSVIGLKARVLPNLFHKGVIRIKCLVSILNWEAWSTKNITHQNKNYQPPIYSSARNQYSSASRTSRIRWWGRLWKHNWSISVLCSSFYSFLFYTNMYNL